MLKLNHHGASGCQMPKCIEFNMKQILEILLMNNVWKRKLDSGSGSGFDWLLYVRRMATNQASKKKRKVH